MSWVAAEYLRRCKKGCWKEDIDAEALKCWNLERILDAELHNQPVPDDLTMDDFIDEEDVEE
jgi:hypothetical protein